MSKVTKQLDFSGEKIFIGIDVHLKSWRVSIFAQERLLKNFTQPGSVDVLGLLNNAEDAVFLSSENSESIVNTFWQYAYKMCAVSVAKFRMNDCQY
jgi:hypothetical protein